MIHTLPPEVDEIRGWLRNLDLGIQYRGEGLPNITYKVLVRLLKKKKRYYLEGEEKHELMEANDYRCVSCGERGRVEWDHTTALSTSFGEQVFEPLCPQCHAQKTSDEPREFDCDPLASHFNSRVWEKYVMTERPPPLIHKHKEVGENKCLIADVRRCRKRALEFNVHDIPVFCPLDDVQRMVDYTLGDINFVTLTPTDCVKQLGYTGSGWQHRAQTEWLLYAGVITWTDIPWKLTATGRLPHDVFRKPLETMEKAWDNGLGKQAVNSMIGLWCLDESFAYKLMSSEHSGDAPLNALKRIVHHPGGTVTDYITKTKLLSSTSHRPPLKPRIQEAPAKAVWAGSYCESPNP